MLDWIHRRSTFRILHLQTLFQSLASLKQVTSFKVACRVQIWKKYTLTIYLETFTTKWWFYFLNKSLELYKLKNISFPSSNLGNVTIKFSIICIDRSIFKPIRIFAVDINCYLDLISINYMSYGLHLVLMIWYSEEWMASWFKNFCDRKAQTKHVNQTNTI